MGVEAWVEHDHALARIATEMTGAAAYFTDHPDYATDEVVANAFREYAARMIGLVSNGPSAPLTTNETREDT